MTIRPVPEGIDLAAAERLLARAVRQCDARHENAVRDPAGNAMFDTYEKPDGGEEMDLIVLPECDDERKHPGCPHFKALYDAIVFPALRWLAETDAECGALTNRLAALNADQLRVDALIRDARIGTEEDRRANKIPHADAAEANAVPYVETFRRNNRDIETVRIPLLAKLREAIAARTPA